MSLYTLATGVNVPIPDDGKVTLVLLNSTRSAAVILDEGDLSKPLIVQRVLDEAIKGIAGTATKPTLDEVVQRIWPD